MKKLLGLFLVSGAMVTGCGNNNADLINRIEDLESETEALQVAYKNAAEQVEATGNFDLTVDAFKYNNDLDKLMWQKWMPETLTVDFVFTLEVTNPGESYEATVWHDVKWVINEEWGTLGGIDNTDNNNGGQNFGFFHHFGSSELFDGLTADETTEYEVKDLVLHRSTYHRQYLMVSPDECTYPGYFTCGTSTAKAEYDSVAAV